MRLTEDLEEILAKCHIIKEYCPLPESVLGYYHCDGNYYIILINESIKGNNPLHRSVLAEEIGHYHTTIGDVTPRKYMCYRDRLTVDKQELLALRWATNYLIPTESLLESIKTQKAIYLEELTDFFAVTPELMMQKLEFMSKQNGLWELDGKRSLYLYRFPSVFIHEKI